MNYLYGMRSRGYSLGCQPTDGLKEVISPEKGKYYDLLRYDRQLTDQELYDYELDDLNHDDVAYNLACTSLFECSACGASDNDTYTFDDGKYSYCPRCGRRIVELE